MKQTIKMGSHRREETQHSGGLKPSGKMKQADLYGKAHTACAQRRSTSIFLQQFLVI